MRLLSSSLSRLKIAYHDEVDTSIFKRSDFTKWIRWTHHVQQILWKEYGRTYHVQLDSIIIKWMRGGGRKEMNRRVSWRERGKGQSIHKVLYDDLIDCSTGMTITMERGVKGSVALLDIYKGVCVLRWIYRVLDSVYYNGKGSKRGFAWHL